MFAFAILLVSAASVVGQTRTVTYNGQKVLRCFPAADATRQAISSLLTQASLDVWSIRADGSIDVRVVEKVDETRRLLLEKQFSRCDTVISDVENFLKEMERERPVNASAQWFEEYRTYPEILLWYEELSDTYSQLVRYSVAGESHEGRPIPVVYITAGSGQGKPRIYFQCLIHAREWISGAVCMYLVDHLVSNYEQSPIVTKILNEVELVIIPVTNPDGYDYAWSGDRLWRKNRAINAGSACRGVDLNRNYDDHWNQGGSSSNPCSETFHGPGAASEPEIQYTTAQFLNNVPVIGAIDWHSYSQLILRPYGYTDREFCPDEDYLKALGNAMSEAAYEVHGVRYVSQRAADLYPASGGADDWFYGENATRFNEGFRAAAYTIELRDTGRYGFLLPPSEIIPTGEEMVPAFLHFADHVIDNPIRV